MEESRATRVEYSSTVNLPKVAIIGGTGIGERLLARAGAAIHVPTSTGILRARLIEDGRALLVARHGDGHRIPPHKINYAAMANGLKFLGIEYCLASAAVGSLRTDWASGTLVACSDFIELTNRNLTLFQNNVVHTDFTHPFDPCARKALAKSDNVIDGGVYISANGPRYETPAEIEFYKKIGGDVVGMTAGSEAVVMREGGIKYACLAVVSNLAAGLAGQELSHEEVVAAMKKSGDSAVKALLKAAEVLNGA